MALRLASSKAAYEDLVKEEFGMSYNAQAFIYPDAVSGAGIRSGSQGINPQKLGNTKAGGDQVEQSTTVVVNNVIYDVTRVFSGKRKAKDLLKCQILTDAASALRSLPTQCYNGVSGLAMEKEVL